MSLCLRGLVLVVCAGFLSSCSADTKPPCERLDEKSLKPGDSDAGMNILFAGYSLRAPVRPLALEHHPGALLLRDRTAGAPFREIALRQQDWKEFAVLDRAGYTLPELTDAVFAKNVSPRTGGPVNDEIIALRNRYAGNAKSVKRFCSGPLSFYLVDRGTYAVHVTDATRADSLLVLEFRGFGEAQVKALIASIRRGARQTP